MKNLLKAYSQEIFAFIKENAKPTTTTTTTAAPSPALPPIPNAASAPTPASQATPSIPVEWETFSKKLEAFKKALKDAGFDSIAAFLESQKATTTADTASPTSAPSQKTETTATAPTPPPNPTA